MSLFSAKQKSLLSQEYLDNEWAELNIPAGVVASQAWVSQYAASAGQGARADTALQVETDPIYSAWDKDHDDLANVTANQHHTKYTDAEAVTAVAAVGGVYVGREEIVAYDFEAGDLTVDNAAHDLDLSSIVPSGAKAVVLFLAIADATINLSFAIRRSDSDTHAGVHARTQVANISVFSNGTVTLPSDDSRVIRYVAETGLSSISVSVTGWFT